MVSPGRRPCAFYFSKWAIFGGPEALLGTNFFQYREGLLLPIFFKGRGTSIFLPILNFFKSYCVFWVINGASRPRYAVQLGFINTQGCWRKLEIFNCRYYLLSCSLTISFNFNFIFIVTLIFLKPILICELWWGSLALAIRLGDFFSRV